jgi:hypothetical protein
MKQFRSIVNSSQSIFCIFGPESAYPQPVSIRKRINGLNRCQNRDFWQASVFPVFVLLLPFAAQYSRADDTNLESQIQALERQNAILEQKLEQQNQSIQSLSERVQDLESTNATQQIGENSAPAPAPPSGYNFGNVNVSGEGGVGFFNTGPQGFAPDSEFRLDEARLFVEAPVWKSVYFQGELDLATREEFDLHVAPGEVYLDFQDISDLWGRDGQLNLRAGNMYIPFGEEYLTRYAIDNPLVSHSVSDFWGYSPGVELYGALGRFTYVAAVQNSIYGDGIYGFDGDKSVAGRFGYDLNRHFHFSVSAMRTGNLHANMTSAIWFGNGFFESLGGVGTTWFHTYLAQGDVTASWSSGYLRAFGGFGHYGDNDPVANNARNFFYYSTEGVQNLPKNFYIAARFSQILCNKGIPVVGFGYSDYYDDALAAELWRLSLGLGYRFSANLLVKAEYAFENGHDIGGEARDHENFFGTEAAFRF